MKTTMNTITKFVTSLESFFGGVMGLALSFVAPIAPFFWLAIGLVLLDTITGIIAARKRKEKINSKGFARLLSKIVVYMASIVACHGVSEVLKLGGNVTYVAVGAIAFTELMSVLENTRVVSGTNIGSVIKRLLPSQEQKSQDEDDPA